MVRADDLAGLLDGPAEQVARRLLGGVITHAGVSVRVTEVEAYAGTDDPASHAWRGETPRTAVMFGPPGRLYVYFSYGMHHAVNLVCAGPGTAAAVLLRAGAVVDGQAVARERRGTADDHRWARGPGNLAQALGLTLADNGLAVGPTLGWTNPATAIGSVCCGPRVGVSRAADRPWRWWLDGDPTVSAYRRSPQADPSTSS